VIHKNLFEMKIIHTLLLLFVISLLFVEQANSIIPVDLKCNFWENPLGVDVTNPVLGWTIKTDSRLRGMQQSAYQILVASSPEKLKKGNGDLWISGKITSEKMGQVVYAGKPLQSSQKYWWKVKIWDKQGKPSAWSEPAQWTMGVLNNSEWKGKWISAAGAEKYAHQYASAHSDFNLKRDLNEFRAFKPKPEDTNYSSLLLRKDFKSNADLVRAVIHVCGLGQYELSLNGSKVGDYLLSPGWSDYRKTVLYDTYDITNQIKAGENVLGLMLSNGMYNIQPDSVRYVKFLNSYGPLKVIVQLRLEYADSTVQTIVSDSTWEVSPGPVIYMNQYGGEDYDARLEPQGWKQPGFSKDDRWRKALECTGPGGDLKGLSCSAPPIKAIESILPVKKTKINSTTWVYDLGQNTSLMPEITLSGPIGSGVRIIPSELIKADGTVDRSSATQDGVRPAWWQYTLATKGTRTWFPTFFYQGARYLQVELFAANGETELPVVEKLNGIVVHTSATPIGTFSCSNDLFNRIYSLVRWAQRSNLVSVITDCPHREKMPWLEQYHLNGPSLRYNYDLLTLFSKSMNDMANSQQEDGFVPNIAPEFFNAGGLSESNGFRNSPEWGSSFIIVPWQQYLFSGDVSLISQYYEKMKKYITFLDASAKENILNIGLGDWYDMGPKEPWGSQLTPVAFTATAIYFYDYQIMSQMAKAIGKTDDAVRFEQKAEAIRGSFNKEFYHPENGMYSTGSNTTYAMPLFLNIAEPQNRKVLINKLVADIRKNSNSFTSGDVGYRFLLKALAMEGYSNVIFDMNNQSERPGYGYQLKMGATALTEKWNAGVGSFGSQNHFMLGQINEWFFHDLAGIGVDADGAGFRKSIIKPMVVGDLTWVKGTYQTVSGLISSEWKRDKDKFTLDVIIPANTTSTIYIPAKNESNVTESGKPARMAQGVKFIKWEKGSAIFEAVSGNYHFVSTDQQ
jgi:alpha-L-rhamnosidase